MEEKNYKLNRFMVIGTFLMAAATFWLGYETNRLKLIDLGPNISLSDLIVEHIDSSKTAVKRFSWREGELVNEGAAPNIESVSLSMKFSNTGKSSGFIKLRGLSLNSKLVRGEESHYLDHYLIPASSESGVLYGYDLLNLFNTVNKSEKNEQTIKIGYDFAIFDESLDVKKGLKVLINCRYKLVDEVSSRIDCVPTK